MTRARLSAGSRLCASRGHAVGMPRERRARRTRAQRPARDVRPNHVISPTAVLLATLPFDIRFVANHVFASPVARGRHLRASAHIVDRGSWRSRAECGETMTESLAAGQSLLVFPEGGTSDDGRLRPFRRGAFQAAARTGGTIVPIVIRGRETCFHPTRTCWPTRAYQSISRSSIARDGTREGVADLLTRTAAAISIHLHSA